MPGRASGRPALTLTPALSLITALTLTLAPAPAPFPALTLPLPITHVAGGGDEGAGGRAHVAGWAGRGGEAGEAKATGEEAGQEWPRQGARRRPINR